MKDVHSTAAGQSNDKTVIDNKRSWSSENFQEGPFIEENSFSVKFVEKVITS